MTKLKSRAHFYHLTKVSGNAKTGPIPVSTTSVSTCPTRCTLYNNGCYAGAGGPLAIHWRKVSEGSRGSNIDDFCAEIRDLPKYALWRYGQAGDLPGDGVHLNPIDVAKLAHANRGKHGYAYTHYDPRDPTNAKIIASANQQGFTVNLSAETLTEVDEYLALNVAPVVVLLPEDQTAPLTTPAGNTVTVCPASLPDATITCATCAICAVTNRRGAIGFPAHGSGKAKAQAIFFQPASN